MSDPVPDKLTETEGNRALDRLPDLDDARWGLTNLGEGWTVTLQEFSRFKGATADEAVDAALAARGSVSGDVICSTLERLGRSNTQAYDETVAILAALGAAPFHPADEEAVERVAKALWDWDEPADCALSISPERERRYRELARAAIAAFREPVARGETE